MADDEVWAQLDLLQRRIISLELLTRIALTAVANGRGRDPVQVIDQIERDTLSSPQLLDRPIDDSSDRIWEAAVNALRLNFDAVRARLRDQAAEGRG